MPKKQQYEVMEVPYLMGMEQGARAMIFSFLYRSNENAVVIDVLKQIIPDEKEFNGLIDDYRKMRAAGYPHFPIK
jgi:hypothetical protein